MLQITNLNVHVSTPLLYFLNESNIICKYRILNYINGYVSLHLKCFGEFVLWHFCCVLWFPDHRICGALFLSVILTGVSALGICKFNHVKEIIQVCNCHMVIQVAMLLVLLLAFLCLWIFQLLAIFCMKFNCWTIILNTFSFNLNFKDDCNNESSFPMYGM